MSSSEMNTYVPAHQLRMRESGGYLWVKWWSGDNTNYAHFHRRNPSGPFYLHSIGRNGTTTAEKEEASLHDLPDGLREALHARYNLEEYQEGDQ